MPYNCVYRSNEAMSIFYPPPLTSTSWRNKETFATPRALNMNLQCTRTPSRRLAFRTKPKWNFRRKKQINCQACLKFVELRYVFVWVKVYYASKPPIASFTADMLPLLRKCTLHSQWNLLTEKNIILYRALCGPWRSQGSSGGQRYSIIPKKLYDIVNAVTIKKLYFTKKIQLYIMCCEYAEKRTNCKDSELL